MSEHGYAAAWVPDDDPKRPWDAAASAAVDWVLGQARRLSLPPLLVTPTQGQWTSGPEAIRHMVQRYEATTPRGNRASSGPHAVLLYVPDYDMFELAAGYARGGVLGVVETVSHPLLGWAVEVQATDLVTGETTPDTRSAALVEALESLHFYGNNGWTTGFGKDQATRILRALQGDGLLDVDLVCGYMLAKGHYGKAVDRLAKIIARLG